MGKRPRCKQVDKGSNPFFSTTALSFNGLGYRVVSPEIGVRFPAGSPSGRSVNGKPAVSKTATLGSIPSRPANTPVAQLVEAVVLETIQCRFESCRGDQC